MTMTFVVRLWTPKEEEDVEAHLSEPMRGVVEHIDSGRSAVFSDQSQMIEFIWTALQGSDHSSDRKYGSK
jgi:hypothetical protein